MPQKLSYATLGWFACRCTVCCHLLVDLPYSMAPAIPPWLNSFWSYQEEAELFDRIMPNKPFIANCLLLADPWLCGLLQLCHGLKLLCNSLLWLCLLLPYEIVQPASIRGLSKAGYGLGVEARSSL